MINHNRRWPAGSILSRILVVGSFAVGRAVSARPITAKDGRPTWNSPATGILGHWVIAVVWLIAAV